MKSELVDAPLIEELPMTLECKLGEKVGNAFKDGVRLK